MNQEIIIAKTELQEEEKEKVNNFTNVLADAFNNKSTMNPTDIINAVGEDEMSSLSTISNSLHTPLAEMASGNGTSDQISDVLIKLKTQVDTINPNNFELTPNWFGRMIEKVTGSSKVSEYFAKFQSANSIIEDIMNSLEEGKFALVNSNKIYQSDRQRYYTAQEKLQVKINQLLEVDAQLTAKTEGKNDPESQYIQEEVIFPLRQKIQDLQQILVVTQQGVISLKILMDNNKTLINSVGRAKNVTKNALTIGVSIAIGLNQQKKTLEAVNSANNAASDMLVANANALQTQGVDIQKQSANAMLKIDSMKEAFSKTLQAIEDVENFKKESLAPMKGAIDELKELSDNVGEKIQKIESKSGSDMLNKVLSDSSEKTETIEVEV